MQLTVRRLCVLCGNKNTEAFTRNLYDIRQKTQAYLRLWGRRLSLGHLSLQLAPPPAVRHYQLFASISNTGHNTALQTNLAA